MPQLLRSAYGRLFSFATVLLSLLLMLIFFLCLGRPLLADPDIWWHLRNAQSLVQAHAFIRVDHYTFSAAGKPWMNPEWLSELPYYLAWRWFGYRGLELVAIAMIELVVTGVFLLCCQRSRNAKAALLACILFLPMISVSLGPRTLMFGWLCLILELALLWEFRRGRDWLWCLPVLFAFWINAHGSWPVGILFLLIFLGCGLFEARWGAIIAQRWEPAQRDKLLWILGLSVAALLLNPYGWRLLAYPFHITFSHKLTVSTVEEWQTLDFHAVRGKITYLVVAGLLVMSMVRRRTWLFPDLIIVLIAIFSAFTYTRFLVAAGIVLCPLLSQEMLISSRGSGKTRTSLNLALIAIAIAVVATHIPSQSTLEREVATAYPEKAIDYIRTHPLDGRLFNDFGWGGYLEWNDPSLAVFIDSRADIFDEWGFLQDYLDATNIRQPLQVLDKYHIRYALFSRKEPLIYLLTRIPGWRTRYEDDVSILLERE